MMERRASTWVEATRAVVTAVESKDITLPTVRTRKEATETVDKEDSVALKDQLRRKIIATRYASCARRRDTFEQNVVRRKVVREVNRQTSRRPRKGMR
jgi:hypothetical protein